MVGLRGPAPTAAAQVGCPVGAIADSLVFSVDDDPLLVLTSGAHRVDTRARRRSPGVAASASGARTRPSSSSATGQEVGGVAPVGHPQPVRTLIDAPLAEHEHLWAGAGMPHTVFRTTFPELVPITGGEPAEVAVGPAQVRLTPR
ncbi:YbaK/EbsC family protein [Streptomyces recifensis]|uniref:YbaK/EbsC family protein n=1 Tax=Streptomyces recifensis TaxID=67355 RepID=UPI001FCA019C|nr:YbaK/EbsC family protein [Streptomyces recifensis]